MKKFTVLTLATSALLVNGGLYGVVLQSFENPSYAPTFYYDTGDWSGTPSALGFSITTGTAASTNGFGQNISSFDLTSLDELSVTLKLDSGNEADFINVLLRTTGGSGTNAYAYTFATSNFNESTFSTANIALSGYSFQLGTGADLSNVNRIQVQGSGSNISSDNVRFTIQTVAAVPEASETALLFGLVVTGLCVWRGIRRKNA